MITGLNHITLAVSDLEVSLDFYQKLLGFKAHVRWQSGVYLTMNELWLCLSLDKPSIGQDYSHLAFSVNKVDFDAMKNKLTPQVRTWKENASEGESFYFLDPDQHKLELHVGNLKSRLESLKMNPYKNLVWLE